jgi:hypothetical protein
MLHVPTLKVVCVRELPLNSKEVRQSVKEWLTQWNSRLNLHEGFINLYGTHYNIPEGAVSIITEYCHQGSLFGLLDSVMTLPEIVIREIFIAVTDSLRHFYKGT